MAKIILTTKLSKNNSTAKIEKSVGIPRLTLEDFLISNFYYLNDLKIINWGYVNLPKEFYKRFQIINSHVSKQISLSKTQTFQFCTQNKVPTVPWTIDKNIAHSWIDEGNLVYARKLTRSRKGKGIVLAKNHEELVKAPLYTKQYLGTGEYRVHVAGGNVIDSVVKKRKGEINNEEIRNHDLGWQFSHNCDTPKHVLDTAIQSMKAVGLDFGGVDIINNRNECALLEINSSPGLIIKETIDAYAKYFGDL